MTDHELLTNSLNFLFSPETAKESPELLHLFQFLVKKASGGRINPESVNQVLTSPNTLRRRIKVHNKMTNQFLLKYLKIVAEMGVLHVTLDHKDIGNTQGDDEKKCLGIEVIMANNAGGKHKKVGIMLEYIPTNVATDVVNIEFLQNFLEDWDLYGK